MNPAALLRLLASLGLLVLLALPACKAAGPSSSPGGGGASRDASGQAAPAESSGRLATRGSTGRHKASRRDAAPVSPMTESEAYGGYDQGVYDYDDSAVATAPTPQRHRPGLGTSYGEQHHSQVTTAPFVRGASQPDVMLSLWYNDPEGVRLAQGSFGRGFDQVSQASTTDGVFVVSVVDEYGYTMSAAQVADKRYVVGEPGQRYKLRVQNNSAFRFEVVASVDGLDVIDGESAGFHKRGYIIEPWSTITVDGWRTSSDSVAAFRFSGMEDSYAERKGEGRNIGVVGFAFFHERGGVPWHELHRRDSADPFPRRFSEPPPPRRWR